MEIRPGLSLLQALSRVSEPKAVPFAQRLSELRGDDAQPAKPPPQSAAAPEPAATEQRRAGPRPRGSVVDILV